MNRISAESVYKSYGGRQVLQSATIGAETGMITGLLGRNGGGKSTLLKLLFGIEPADDIFIHFNGRRVIKPYQIEGLVHYLPQKPFIPGAFTPAVVLRHLGMKPHVVLDHFPELEEDLTKKMKQLSGGRERLWSILSVVLAPGKFALLDEPFSHIMPLHVQRLKDLIVNMKYHKGFIITDHLYAHILDMSDQLYLMKEGRTIFLKDKQNLILHGYLRQLANEE